MSFNDSINSSSPSLRSLRDVRILLIGDRGVGKTSLIRTLMNDKFVSDVPPRSADVAVPPEMTQKEVTTYIIDTSLRVQDESEIASELLKASVICAVYAADKKDTYKRISSFWLPFIRDHLQNRVPSTVPVILVRNKSDLCDLANDTRKLRESESESPLLNECMAVMQEFKEIVTCVDCSAKAVKHIPDIFHYALNSVLFPMAPLYDLEDQNLKPKVIKALDRVFIICDRDKDGLLNDRELNGFQTCCFQGSEPLAVEELKNVKELIALHVPSGLKDGKVTKDGFLFLNRLFVERAKPETTWAVLRHFGYSDELELKDSYIYPKSLKQCPQDCSLELSEEGLEFLTELFNVHQKAAGMEELSQNNLAFLFQIVDEYPPIFRLASGSTCSISAFLDRWRLLVFLNHEKATRLLAELGFCVPKDNRHPRLVARAISMSRRRVIDWERKFTSRKSFLCYVLGPPSLRNKFFKQSALNGIQIDSLCRPYWDRLVGCSYGESMITFADIITTNDTILNSEKFIAECDVAILLYEDGGESFEAKHFGSVAGTGPPVLLVGLNSFGNLDKIAALEDERICAANGFAGALLVAPGEFDDVIKRVFELAMKPGSGNRPNDHSLLVYIGITITIVAVGTILYKRCASK